MSKASDREILEKWADSLGLDKSTVDQALEILKMSLSKSVGNISRQSRLAGALYLAVKDDPLCPPISLIEFGSITYPNEKNSSRRKKYVMELPHRFSKFGIEISKPKSCTYDPKRYIPMICRKLSLPDEVVKLSYKISDIFTEAIPGANPNIVAGAIVYIVAYVLSDIGDWKKPTQKDVAETIGANEATLRNSYIRIKVVSEWPSLAEKMDAEFNAARNEILDKQRQKYLSRILSSD